MGFDPPPSRNDPALATASMEDYRSLPPGFWARLAEGSLELDGQVYA